MLWEDGAKFWEDGERYTQINPSKFPLRKFQTGTLNFHSELERKESTFEILSKTLYLLLENIGRKTFQFGRTRKRNIDEYKQFKSDGRWKSRTSYRTGIYLQYTVPGIPSNNEQLLKNCKYIHNFLYIIKVLYIISFISLESGNGIC